MSNFPSTNYLNELAPDQKIYRIFREDHFQELWLEKRLGFVRPALWPDPYENFLLKGTVDVDGRPVSLKRLREAYYCLCWTIRDESASMWDRYAHGNASVRIRTTASKLADVLYAMAFGRGTANYVQLNCFVGKVNYVKQAEMEAILMDKAGRLQKLADTTGRNPAIGLMMKRDVFKDENEVRAFYAVSSDKENVGTKSVLHGSIPDNFIEEVCFHPRLPMDEYREKAEHLKLNGVPAPVIRSTLYDEPIGV